MNSKSHYLYISSKNRSESEEIYDFNVILNNPIIMNRNQGVNISVVSFSMMNTDYNLRNCILYIQELHYTPIIYSLLHIITIPDGNYSYITLMEFLKNNTEFNTYLDIEYIRERNSYKFTNKMAEGKIKILPFKFIGINSESIVETSIEGSYINLTNYSHIIIKSNNILFEDSQEDNINNKEMSNSSILFMIDKQDISPFQLISYRNYDKSDNYSYNISNRHINSIDLHLYNEKGELLTTTDDYYLTLKFVIFNKEEIKSDTSFLEDIRFILMNLMFDKKNIMLK